MPPPPADPAAPLRPLVEQLGTALLRVLPDASPRHVADAALAVAYRLVVLDLAEAAHGTPGPLTPRRLATVGPHGPLGPLGWPDADRLGDFEAPLDALDALDAPDALAALPPPPDPHAPDPTGLAAAHQAFLACEPVVTAGAFTLRAPGRGRRAAGSFYTPTAVVAWLLDRTLEPALDDAARAPDPVAALRALRVLDPACGAGAFLVPAARRIRARLLDADRDAHAAVACVHGVDLDPHALFVARAALWLDALRVSTADPRILAATLARNLRHGDARLGVDPDTLAAGLPDLAFAPGPDDDRAALSRWRARNRAERAAPAPPLLAAPAHFAPRAATPSPITADAWCAAFFWPRGADAPPPPTTATLRDLAAGRPVAADTIATVDALARLHHFLHWHHAFPDGGFDVVLGNPPFLNQLERDTVTTRPAAALQRARLGDTVGAYTDTAALLLLQGARLLRPGGRLGMVQPQSTLAAKDARGVRSALTTLAPPTHAWWAGQHVFPGISVYVAALVLHRGPPTPIRRAHGLDFAPLPDLPADAVTAESWTPLVADALGAPAVHLRGPGRLADLCRATADFRDEYYGLVPFVLDRRDADEDRFPRLVLTGHVDPARSWWGERTVRFGRRAWDAPRVDLAALEADGSLAAWAAARRVPKLLLATQTRVLEAVADPDGRWLTTTPTVTVLPAPDALWRVAAVLLGPPASAWALAHYGASALAAGAIKLAARQVEAIPTPSDDTAWNDAAALVAAAHASADPATARAHLDAAAVVTVRAYGADPALVGWWRDRLPSTGAR